MLHVKFCKSWSLDKKVGASKHQGFETQWVRAEGHQVLRVTEEGRKQTHVPSVFVVSLNSQTHSKDIIFVPFYR